MNTPNQTTITQQNIALNLLCPSLTNPRKRFDDGKLRELAASIKNQGVLQPLLVRQRQGDMTKTTWPFPTKDDAAIHYEIVAGERRYRAAKIAGLTEIPCFVRELTDLQVLHAQVIENLQRDDLHPLEEADGYAKLMKNHGATADSLAAEIGKSKAYIYARLKFIDLCQEAREAFYQGELDASTALLVARIPVTKLQIQATKKITEKAHYDTGTQRKGDKLMSYRAARDLLQREYMTDLSNNIFPTQDATLIPKAGACTDCAKRTGNQPELFDDVDSKDVCTDTVCFAMKRTAHILAIQKKAEAEGCAVIIGKEAKKIMPNNQYRSHPAPTEESGLVRLDQTIPNDSEGRTWEQALGKQAFASKLIDGKPAVQKMMVENPHNKELIPTVKIEDAIKALRDMGIEVKLTGSGVRQSSGPSKDDAKIKAKVELAQKTRQRLFEALHNKIKTGMLQNPPYVPDVLYRVLAEACFENLNDYDSAKHIAKLYMPGVDEEDAVSILQSQIGQLSIGEQFLLCIDCLMSGELGVTQWNIDRRADQMLTIAAPLCIDAKQIEKEVIAESKPVVKKAAKPVSSVVKKAEAKTISTPSTAAQAQVKPAPKKLKAAPANVKAAVKPKSKAIAKAANAA